MNQRQLEDGCFCFLMPLPEAESQVSMGCMASAVSPSRTGYHYLEPRPNSFYRELFVRGVNLRASRLVAWLEAEGLSPQQAAADRGLPVEIVLEAIDYCRHHRDVIEDDLQREQDLLKQRDLHPS